MSIKFGLLPILHVKKMERQVSFVDAFYQSLTILLFLGYWVLQIMI